MTPSFPIPRPARGGPVALVVALAAGLAAAVPADAQIRRDPTGVNVAATSGTTVFITFGNLQGMVPVEATWCGELVSAAPDVGERCDPSTVFGHLPLRFDLARSTADVLTDVMSIPPSVARRAYQAAQEGADSRFFYVRRFVDPSGLRSDEYVTVTCRLTGGGARTPFSLLDVRLAFATDAPVLSLDAGAELPPAEARIAYNGTGRLVGRWELVRPGEEPPTDDDLLTEATLPPELRGTQRRYTEVGRFDLFLPPTGEVVLPGPDPERVPVDAEGLHMLLLRIEATPDREGDVSLEAVGAGEGVLSNGAVAGFPIPPLRFFVGGAGDAPERGSALLRPGEGAALPADEPLTFQWRGTAGAALERLEVTTPAGEPVLSALLRPGADAYRAPGWLASRLPDGRFRWRVVGLGAEGAEMARTEWRTGRLGDGG